MVAFCVGGGEVDNVLVALLLEVATVVVDSEPNGFCGRASPSEAGRLSRREKRRRAYLCFQRTLLYMIVVLDIFMSPSFIRRRRDVYHVELVGIQRSCALVERMQ